MEEIRQRVGMRKRKRMTAQDEMEGKEDEGGEETKKDLPAVSW